MKYPLAPRTLIHEKILSKKSRVRLSLKCSWEFLENKFVAKFMFFVFIALSFALLQLALNFEVCKKTLCLK